MTLTELSALIDARPLAQPDMPREATCGYVCDLLSWVMARGQPGMAWVTVQTHLNVIAVASLHEMACVIMPDDIKMEEAVRSKALEEGIAVYTSPLSAYEICGRLMAKGLAPQPD